MKFLHLNFLPRSADLALLLLRVWFGGAMLALHGWDKLMNFGTYSGQFMKFLGLSQSISLGLAIFGELVCAALLVLGLFTRFAALGVGIAMGVAFWMAHGGKLSGEGSGEMAFLYLGVFAALFLAGGGKYSVDAKIGAKN
jgi:putative oxidoreductase